MIKTLFMILLAFAAMLPAKVTLTQAVTNAWKISSGLDSQRLEEKSAATARLTAMRQKFFSVSFNGSYRYSSDKVEVKLDNFPLPLSFNVPPGTVLLSAPNDNLDLKISLIQPLYSGGVLDNAVKIETAREAAERDMTRLKKIDLAGKVKGSFYLYRLFCKKREELNFLLDSVTLHQGKQEKLFNEELVRKSDLLETRAKADEIRINLEDLDQLIQNEGLNFSTLCGYDPQDVEEEASAGRESFAAARQTFLNGHPLLRSLDERVRVVQIQKKSISGSYRPQVSAFAELHYGKPGQNFFLNRWTPYVQGGLSVSMPVFNWNRGDRDRTLADIAARKLENQRADFIRESEKNLRQLFLQKGSVEKKVALLDKLIANAAEDARLKEKLYEENQIDHTDYLAALTSQERYISNREELLAQVEILHVSIDTVIGKYEEEE